MADYEDIEDIEALKISVNNLITEKKELKLIINKEAAFLHENTRKTIEKLAKRQVLDLLEKKWIDPIVSAMIKLPQAVVSELIGKIETLVNKYSVTYAEIANQTRDTERTLSNMINDLSGNEFDMKGLIEFQALLKGGKK